jgi:hypothetical protein
MFDISIPCVNRVLTFSLALQCTPWMLVKRATEQVDRQERNHFHLLHHLVHHWYLDGCCQQVSNG